MTYFLTLMCYLLAVSISSKTHLFTTRLGRIWCFVKDIKKTFCYVEINNLICIKYSYIYFSTYLPESRILFINKSKIKIKNTSVIDTECSLLRIPQYLEMIFRRQKWTKMVNEMAMKSLSILVIKLMRCVSGWKC